MKRFSTLGVVAALLLGVAPARAADLQTELDAVVQAEKAFSRTSVEKGMRDSFVEFLAADGILFRPDPVPGKEWTRARPAPSITLIWRPVHADIARSADLGYTTGPWEIRNPESKEVLGHGQYITVWKKQADGSWKVAIDIGIGNEKPVSPAPTVDGPETPIRLAAKPQGEAPVADPKRTKVALLTADRELSQASVAKGAAAYADGFADDARLFRFGSFPYVGKEAARDAVTAEKRKMSWEPAGGDVSRAGDLGYTYGKYELAGGGPDDKGERGNYMRIWKREPGGPWRVVVDVTNPPPPPPPAAPPAPAQEPKKDGR
jgi:ketosteroid isomerase-like protein